MRFPVFAAACGVVASCLSPAAAPATIIASSELVFTPVTPCRAFNTRATTPITGNQSRSFRIADSTDLSAQGGAATGCGVPASASAVALSLTALDETAAGYLTVYASGAARPTVVALSYAANTTLTNTVIAAVGGKEMSVFTSRRTNVAGDVVGYYAPPIIANIAADGTLVQGTTRVLSVIKSGTGVYDVTIDRDVSSCIALAQSDNDDVIVYPAPQGRTQRIITNRRVSEAGYAQQDQAFRFLMHC
jgi:hypothetical protein